MDARILTKHVFDEQFKAHAADLRLHVDVLGDGPMNAEVAVVGEGPGETEVRLGKPFVGGSGRLLWDTLRRYGLTRDKCYTTNVVKRQISLSRKGNEKHIVLRDEQDRWVGMLQWELSQLPNLRIVFVLGNYALEALSRCSGVLKWRGSVLPVELPNGNRGRLVVTINPAYALREPKLEPVFMLDAHKLNDAIQNTFKEHHITHIINPSYGEARALLRDLQKSDRPVAYDIEALNGETVCHGFSNDPHVGICINLRDSATNRFTASQEVDILLDIQHLCDSHRIIAQNGSFDAYWTRLHDWLSVKIWFDVLLAHHTLYPQLPHNLGFLVAQYTNHPFYKDEGKAWKEGGNIDEFWRYNCLTGDTKVLRSDLSWYNLEDVKPGDKLLSFEEHGYITRKLRECEVSKAAGSKKAVVKVVLSNGQSIRGTMDHQVIAKRVLTTERANGTQWIALGDLRPGDALPTLGAPWAIEHTREAGWLAGIFDGEGTSWDVCGGGYPRVGFSQKEGPVLERAKGLLHSRGIAFNAVDKGTATYVDIHGGLSGTLRFLGTIAPQRLVSHTLNRLPQGFGGFSNLPQVKVLGVFDDGEDVVYDITTSTGTFIANGIVAHNCKDAALTYAAYERVHRELKAQKLDEFFFGHVMRAQPHLVSATVHGVAVDMDVREKINQLCGEDVAKLKADFYAKVHEATGDYDYFPNPNSHHQLRELFFQRLKLPGRTNSTDEDNRNHILKDPRTPSAAAEMLVALDKYKKEDKFYGTYVQAEVSKDGRFRCEYKQYGVSNAPGRLSSAALLTGEGGNMQNQPVRARGMYVADPECVFCYFDLAQAESQVVSFRADIPKWKEQYARARKDGSYDAHRALASEMFKVPYDEVPTADFVEVNGIYQPTIRYTAKRCRHALNYRMERFRLSEVTGLPYHTAAHAFTVYHSITPELMEWWRVEETNFKATREIYNALGRRFRVIQRIDDEVLKSIVAFFPQSTIGDKITQVWYQAEEDDDWPDDARVAIDVHDNLVAIATEKTAKTCLRILKKYAESPIWIQDAWKRRKHEPLSIPAETKISVPSSWDDTKKAFVADPNGRHRWSFMEKVKL